MSRYIWVRENGVVLGKKLEEGVGRGSLGCGYNMFAILSRRL